MLSTMRTHQKKILIAITFPIILVFVLYYGVSRDMKRRGSDAYETEHVALVNKTGTISRARFLRAYANNEQYLRSNYGEQWDETLVDRLELEKNVLDQLIHEELLYQAAKEAGLKVTDAEVISFIETNEARPRGRSVREWLEYLVMLGNDLQEYFDSQKRSVLITKMQRIITSNSHVTEQELLDAYREREEKVKADYLAFDPKTYVSQVPEPSDDALQAFFDQNKERFRVADKVKVKYLQIDPKTFTDTVLVTQEAIERYYEDHAEEYETPEQVQVEHLAFLPENFQDRVVLKEEDIVSHFEKNVGRYRTEPQMRVRYIALDFRNLMDGVSPSDEEIVSYYEENPQGFFSEEERRVRRIHVPFDDADSGEQKTEKRELIRKIKSEIEEGLSFEDAARTYSQDEFRNVGGLMGYRTYGELASLGIADSVFELDPGETSDVVSLPNGLALVHVEDIKEATRQSLNAVRDKVAEVLKYNKAEQQARESLTDLKSQMGNQIDLTLVPEGYVFRETRAFERGTHVDDVVGDDDYRTFTNEAFRLSAGQISEPVPANRNWYLIEALEKIDARDMTLEEARERVSADKTREEALVIARQEVENAAEMIRDGHGFDEIAKSKGVEIFDTGLLYKEGRVPEIGWNAAEFLGTAFQMIEGEISNPVASPRGFHILRFLDRVEARIPDLDETISNSIRQKLNVQYSVEAARSFGESVILAAVESVTLSEVTDQESEQEEEPIAPEREVPIDLELGLQKERDYFLAHNRSLDEAARQSHPIAQMQFAETSLFAEDDYPEPIGQAPELVQVAFKMKQVGDAYRKVIPRAMMGRPNEISDFFLITLTDKIEAHIPEISEVSEEVREAFLHEQGALLAKAEAEVAHSKLTSWIADYRAGAGATAEFKLSDFAQENGSVVQNAPSLTRNSPFGIYGQCPDVAYAAMQTAVGECTGLIEATTPVVVENKEVGRKTVGYFILQVLEHTEPDMNVYRETERAKIQNGILNERRNAAIQDWLKQRREQSSIEIKMKDL